MDYQPTIRIQACSRICWVKKNVTKINLSNPINNWKNLCISGGEIPYKIQEHTCTPRSERRQKIPRATSRRPRRDLTSSFNTSWHHINQSSWFLISRQSLKYIFHIWIWAYLWFCCTLGFIGDTPTLEEGVPLSSRVG